MKVANSKKIKNLHFLIDDNFTVAKHCRATMETISEISFRHYFQKLAAKRSQFAIELGNQLKELGENKPYIPTSTYESRWSEISDENKLKNVRKSLKLFKRSLSKYKRALSKVNDGNCREILIRHKAIIAGQITELRSLKNLIKEKIETTTGQGSSTHQEELI